MLRPTKQHALNAYKRNNEKIQYYAIVVAILMCFDPYETLWTCNYIAPRVLHYSASLCTAIMNTMVSTWLLGEHVMALISTKITIAYMGNVPEGGEHKTTYLDIKEAFLDIKEAFL